jgi:ATP synthase subunit 6
MKIKSPLEGFEVDILRILNANSLILVITSYIVYIIISIIIICIIILNNRISKSYYIIPNKYQMCLEKMYINLMNYYLNQVGRKGIKYYPLFVVLVITIFIFNLIGLIPLGFSISGQIISIFCLAFTINIGCLIIAMRKFKLKTIYLFIPKNISNEILPFIILIEIISYFLRIFSLSIRLFANMLAGHTLMYLISSFLLSMFYYNNLLSVLVGLILLLVIVVLEVGVCILQTYVFVTLTCIYLDEVINKIKHENTK